MNTETNQGLQESLARLIKSIQLRAIQFADIHSIVTPAGMRIGLQNAEFKISWGQVIAKEDPVNHEDKTLIFRPKYDFSIGIGADEIFHATMIALLQFNLENKADFEASWANEEVRKIFQQRQLMHTMWPILRQQVMDCMNRHSLPSITLPWLV